MSAFPGIIFRIHNQLPFCIQLLTRPYPIQYNSSSSEYKTDIQEKNVKRVQTAIDVLHKPSAKS